MIVELLEQGYQHRKSEAELCNLTGLTPNVLVYQIKKERKAGELILATKQGGYYLPANDFEIANYVKRMTGDALAILQMLKPYRSHLKQNPQQLELESIIAELESEISKDDRGIY